MLTSSCRLQVKCSVLTFAAAADAATSNANLIYHKYTWEVSKTPISAALPLLTAHLPEPALP